MSGGRNPYSTEDDSYLVKYIATYNPTVSGRSGNALYQRLCENADRKWPWSARHPWASWRDRYCKNSDRFDGRIKRYIKKHDLPVERKKDMAAFIERRAREGKGAARDTSEDNDDGDLRARKRKRAPDDDNNRRVKVKQEPVDESKHALLSQRRQEERPKPSTAHIKRESKVVVKKEKESVEAEAEAAVDVDNADDESSGGEDEEVGPRSEPPNSDDYTEELFQSVPPIVTEDVSDTETETSAEDSELQEDELDPTQPTIVQNNSQQDNGPSLYPDISTLPSPHLQERNRPSQLPSPASKHKTSTRASSPPLSRQRPRSSPQPVASTSRVKLSPSHRLSRSSSLLRDTRPKPKVPKDDDFFASVPETPTSSSTSPPPPVKRKPPQLVEGAYRNVFMETPHRGSESDDSSDEEERQVVWPPVRKKKLSDAQLPSRGETGQPRFKVLNPGVGVKEMTSRGGPQPKKPDEQLKAAPKDGQTPLSRRVSLPLRPPKAEHHPFARQMNGITADQEPPKAATAQRAVSKGHTPTEQARGARGGSSATTTPGQQADRNPQRTSSFSSVLTRKSESVQGSSRTMADARLPALQTTSRVITLANTSQRRSSSLRHEAKLADHSPPKDSNTPGNPFKANPAAAGAGKEKGKMRAASLFERRHTIDLTSDAASAPVHRDLRSFHQPRQSLPARTHIPTATSTPESTSQPSLLPIPIADEDRFKVEYLGMSAAVGMIAKRFAVAEEVVWRGWEKTKSISKTEEYCRRLAELNAQSEATVLKEMKKSGIIVEETPDHAARSRSHRVAGQRRLQITPLVKDEEDVMSEYTPPQSTRAAQYARLARQGRTEEALSREWRRASFGGGAFPQRHERGPEYSSPARGTDGGRAEPEAGSEGVRDPGGTPPDTPSLSAAGENMDAEDDAGYEGLEGLDEEVFLSATVQNAEALREIERGVDPDLMVQWTAGLLASVRDRASLLPRGSAG